MLTAWRQTGYQRLRPKTVEEFEGQGMGGVALERLTPPLMGLLSCQLPALHRERRRAPQWSFLFSGHPESDTASEYRCRVSCVPGRPSLDTCPQSVWELTSR